MFSEFSPSFSPSRMNQKFVYRKSWGLSFWTFRENYELLLGSVRTGKDVGLDMERRRFQSCISGGIRVTSVLPSRPSVESHVAANSTSWWPRAKA